MFDKARNILPSEEQYGEERILLSRFFVRKKSAMSTIELPKNELNEIN